MELSLARAESVKASLEADGVGPKVLTANGFGDTKPLYMDMYDPNATKNMRVEIELFAENSKELAVSFIWI